jgi:pimeloyl-ACP methyl ester carboxylesterase
MKNQKNLGLCTIAILLVIAGMIPNLAVAVKPQVTYDSTWQYTRYVGQLGRADYEIFMPDNWNGHLVIGCKGFTVSTTTPFPALESLNTHQIGHLFMNTTALATGGKRFAYAQSTYNEIGFCMQAGMIHTHQLTEYIIDNFGVTGKIFLIGLSMGGQIDLMLADKYPDLYAGVLDVCGNKDTTAFYNYWKDLANIPTGATDAITANSIRTYFIGPPTSLPTAFVNAISDAKLLAMRTSAIRVIADVEEQFGGTPESKPQAYDRFSPTCHADISLPVISLVARLDLLVPIQHFNAYYDAVSAAGCLANYRSYLIAAQHCDNTVLNKIPTYFPALFNWANSGTVPPLTGKPLP